MTKESPQTAGTIASIALLAFAGASIFALTTWLLSGRTMLHWKVAVTLVCALAAIFESARLWRHPTRGLVGASLVTVLVSLVRVGPPSDWNGFSFALLSLTILFSLPLVHAVFVLRK